MLLTRKNPRAGKRLTGFPIVREPRSDQVGYKLGYCDGCGEPIIALIHEAREIAANFVGGVNVFDSIIGVLEEKQKPKLPLGVKIASFFLSKEYIERLQTPVIAD